MKTVTCNKCNWVYVQVSKAYVENWQDRWKAYWPTLDKEGREAFGLPNGPPTTREYLVCWCGNGHTNFRDAVDGDCPDGCTMGGILDRDEEL